MGFTLTLSPKWGCNTIPTKITSPQSQGSQGYVVNMDAQIILSNNIATFFNMSEFQIVMAASNPSSKF
jgi:hypothetical protein